MVPEDANLLKKFRRWTIWEHSGRHVIPRLPRVDHYRKLEAESTSLLGEAPKGIFINPATDAAYLFKWPKIRKDGFTHGFRESVSELIMSRLTMKLISAADVRMVNYKEAPVLISRIFVNLPERLVHGVEVFKELYDSEGIAEIQNNRDAQRRFYSVQHICEALKEYCGRGFEKITDDFCTMLLVDAWLGNQDRHAENWGIIRSPESSRPTIRFAPVFDTARGIFWNDTLIGLKKKYNLNVGAIRDYMYDSLPLVSLDNKERANHFDIAKYIMDNKPNVFRSFLHRLNSIDISIEIGRYRGMLHDYRCRLIELLLTARREEIRRIKG